MSLWFGLALLSVKEKRVLAVQKCLPEHESKSLLRKKSNTNNEDKSRELRGYSAVQLKVAKIELVPAFHPFVQLKLLK